MFKLLATLLLIFNVSLFAEDGCIYGLDRSSIVAEWEAYKTKGKIPVNGTFHNINISINEKARSLKALLEGSMALVDAQYVFTNHQERDATLLQNFFAYLAPMPLIKAIITDVDELNRSLNLVLVMNGQTKVVPMQFGITNGNFHAMGDIDVVKDFGLEKALDNLNKACFNLHESVTWPNVTLHLGMKMGKLCKETKKEENLTAQELNTTEVKTEISEAVVTTEITQATEVQEEVKQVQEVK